MSQRTADQTTDDIMRATYCALCEHGYAGLTMQDIADHSKTSKSSLHYHYDTKQDLLLAFLDHLFERFQNRVDTDAEDPLDRLTTLLDATLGGPNHDADRDFETAMLEIKAQAPYDEQFRERLAEFDAYFSDLLREAVSEGVESGVFRDGVDPDETADFLVTVVNGAHTRRVATNHSLAAARRTLATYLEQDLLAADSDREVGFERGLEGEFEDDSEDDSQ